jgi:hypothetical protein
MAISKGVYATFGVQDGNNTTATVSGSVDSTGKGLLVAYVSFEGAPDAAGTISDNKSNTSWVEIARVNNTVGGGDMTSIMYAHYAPNVGAGHTVTWTPGSARPFKRSNFTAVNGSFANSTCLDAVVSAQGVGTAYDAGTLNTTATAFITQWNVNYAGELTTPAGSWVGGDEDVEVGGREIISKVQTGSVSGFDPTTTGVVSVNWNAICAAFKEVVAGATRGKPFGDEGTAFDGGRTFTGPLSMGRDSWQAQQNLLSLATTPTFDREFGRSSYLKRASSITRAAPQPTMRPGLCLPANLFRTPAARMHWRPRSRNEQILLPPR